MLRLEYDPGPERRDLLAIRYCRLSFQQKNVFQLSEPSIYFAMHLGLFQDVLSYFYKKK